MDVFFWIMGALLLNSVLGAAGLLALWIKNEERLRALSYLLVAFSAGALIGGGFLHLLPEAMANLPIFEASILIICGFVVFLILETYLHWHSCERCDIHPFTQLVLIGDGIHNIIDGVVVAVTFIASIPLGIATTLAVLAHELPQELGIFGVQVHGGVKKEIALTRALFAQATCLIGGVIGYIFVESAEWLVTYTLPFAAGGFVYIAASDLIPELHKEKGVKKLVGLIVFFVALAFMYILKVYGGE
ncbi:MAG: ZIP family metal transporter [Candidatus Bilamarchaeaceae archaeon]